MQIRKYDYTLKEGKGLRGLIYKLFSTNNQPYLPKLKVRCTFYRQDSPLFERTAEVEYPVWHFEPVVIDNIIVGENLVIDSGYITLYDKKERYLTMGTPPFNYLFNDPSPCPGWMTKMLKEDGKC